MVVIDTSILIDYFRTKRDGHSPLEILAVNEKQDNLAMSILTIQELYQGKSVADPRQEEIIVSVTSTLKMLPYTYEVAKRASEIVRGLGRLVSFADAAIAATAIINGAKLATLNQRDFSGIQGLELATIGR